MTLDVERLSKALCATNNGHYRGWDAPLVTAALPHDHLEDARYIAAEYARLAAAANPDYMCPNCVTPWKCNWPHFLEGEVPTPMEGRPPPDDVVGA